MINSNKDYRKIIANKIKRARKKRGWAQKHLAKKIGCDDSSISNWEIGKRLPDIITIKKLEKLLGIKI